MINLDKNKISFSIVIPTKNRIDELAVCINRLIIQLIEDDEIIISEDDKSLISQLSLKDKYPNIKWLLGPCKGPAANRNHGAKYASRQYIIFLDDDCVPSERLLHSYRSYVENNSTTEAIEGCIRPIGQKNSLAAECPVNEIGGNFWSCNILIKRSVFQSINGFDEDFPFACMEDVEIYRRLKLTGANVTFLNSAYVMHPWVIRKDQRSFQHYRLSMLLFLAKYPEERKRFSLIYLMRLMKMQLKELLVNGFFHRHTDKNYFICKMFHHLSFAWMLKRDNNVSAYVNEMTPCCDGCQRILHKIN